MDDRTLLSVGEVADLFGCTPKTIRAWIKSGKLRASQPGRKFLIQWRDARNMLKNSVVKISVGFPTILIIVNIYNDNVSI